MIRHSIRMWVDINFFSVRQQLRDIC